MLSQWARESNHLTHGLTDDGSNKSLRLTKVCPRVLDSKHTRSISTILSARPIVYAAALLRS